MTDPTGDDVATGGPAARHRPDKKASGKASRRCGTSRALKNMNRWFRRGRLARSGAGGPAAPAPTPPEAHGSRCPTQGGGPDPEGRERRDYYPDE